MTAVDGRRGPDRRSFVRRFVDTPTGWLAAGGILALIVLAAFGSTIAGDQATAVRVDIAGQGPSGDHWLGTDALGRDILARTLSATRTSLLLGALATLITAAGGIGIGLVVANSRGRLQRGLTAALDALMGFPVILVAIVTVMIVGIGPTGATVAVGLAYVPAYARLTNTLAASVLGRGYVEAARVVGVRGLRLQRRYVVPNIVGALAVALWAQLSEAIVAVAALSFLGLGIQTPDFDWGRMLTEGIQAFYLNPPAALAPAGMMLLAGVVASLTSDATARASDPLQWR